MIILELVHKALNFVKLLLVRDILIGQSGVGWHGYGHIVEIGAVLLNRIELVVRSWLQLLGELPHLRPGVGREREAARVQIEYGHISLFYWQEA